MIYEQLLHEFVDGALDYQEETDLFSELHANEGLRSELKMLILMGRSATHDINAFVPAPESRAMILDRLGFSSDAGTAMGTGGVGFLRRSMHGLLGGVIGALLTAVVLIGFDLSPWLVVREAGSAPPSGTSAASSITAATSAGIGREGTVPPVASVQVSAASGAAPSAPAVSSTMLSGKNQPRGLAASSSKRRDNAGGTQESESSDRDIPPQAFISARAVELRRLDTLPVEGGGWTETSLERSHDAPVPIAPSSLESQGLEIPPVTIEYRALASRSFATRPAALANASDALLLDNAAAARYRLNDRQSIGVEIGLEEFYQSFEQQLTNGDFIRHEQNPVLFWGGVAYRQYVPLGSDLRPFLGLVAGATRVGPVGRLAIGASYEVSPEISFLAGGELSALGYRFQNRWYFTPKYALTYGISLNF